MLPSHSIGPEVSINPLALLVHLQISSGKIQPVFPSLTKTGVEKNGNPCPCLHSEPGPNPSSHIESFSPYPSEDKTDYFQPEAQQAYSFSSVHGFVFLLYLWFIVIFKIFNDLLHPRHKTITTYASLE